jgi:multidrug efflux system outer membrane protein
MKKSFTALLLPVLMSGSCTVGPDFKVPLFNAGEKWKQNQSTTPTALPDTWWRLYKDAELNRLVDLAFKNNNDLAAAKARVDTARALAGVDRAKLFPELNLNASANRSRASEDSLSDRVPTGVAIDAYATRYRSTFDLSFDPDLWGRNKRQLESSSAQADAQQALLDSQRLGLASEVARQYFLLRSLDDQEAILNETIKSRSDALSIQQSRADAGLADGLTSSRARTEVELARNDLTDIQRQRGSTENALAVLCGHSPSSFSIARDSKLPPIPSIHAGAPAEVLNRRPDVRAAEQSLRRANATIGVAQANFYPNFTINASAGAESADVSRFLDWQNRVLSIGAGVTAPVFNAGSNRASFDAAVSTRDEALANYRNSLIVALREVEDSLLDLKTLANSRQALEQALASAELTKRLAQERFDKGLTNYLEVVDADRTVLQARLLLSQTDARQRITFAVLAKALGGGWSGK